MNEQEKDMMKLDHQLCFPLYAASRRIINLYNPYFKPLGITYTQYLVFLVLWEEDGRTVGEIGRKLYLDNGTLTPLLKKLETAGYIRRERSSSDERIVLVYLTARGRKLQEKVADIPSQVGACVALPGKKAQDLYKLLYELLEKLTEEPATEHEPES